MANNNLFSPQAGFAQSQYYDQMSTALPGQLANASDINLVDSMVVGQPVSGGSSSVDLGMGLLAGVAVQMADLTNTPRPGINEEQILPYASGGTPIGVTVRNQQMDSNSNGEACWFPYRMANVLRFERVGGRIWVRLAEETDQPTFNSPVYLAVGGLFTVAAGSGSPANIEIPGAYFVSTLTATQAGKIALVEFGRRA